MRTHLHGPARSFRPSTHTRAEQPDAFSAARLAAEAAFTAAPISSSIPSSLPSSLPSASSAAVQVRVVPARRRLQPHEELQLAPAAIAPQQPAIKPPRVFRLDDAPGQRPLLQSKAPSQVGSADKVAEPAPRRTAAKAVKRPGPVVRQLAEGAHAAGAAAADTGVGHTSPPALLHSLSNMLADLEPTFAQIRFAQAFRIEWPSDI